MVKLRQPFNKRSTIGRPVSKKRRCSVKEAVWILLLGGSFAFVWIIQQTNPISSFDFTQQNAQTVHGAFQYHFTPEKRLQMNTPEALEQRLRAAQDDSRPLYRHRQMVETQFGTSALLFLKLVLRTLTSENIFAMPLPEPMVSEDGQRVNSGCDIKYPDCVFTHDAFARAMITADLVMDTIWTRKIPGVLVEVGVSKGGMSAYLQALLLVTGEYNQRDVWLVDSFQRKPTPESMTSNNDKSKNKFNGKGELDIDVSMPAKFVQYYLDRVGLMESNVKVLEGFVHHTLPQWQVESPIAVLKVGGTNVYSTTFDALYYLYPRLAAGGVLLLENYTWEYTREAIVEYRKQQGISAPIQFLPGCVDPIAFWIKEE